MGSMQGMVSWDALRLFAALTPAQRTSLAEGARLPFDTLGPGAKSSLRRLLYGAGDNLTVERAGVSNENDPLSMGIKMMMGGGGVDARDEPTEVAPNGLPAGGYLQAQVTTDAVIRPTGADGPSYHAFDLDELAMLQLVSSSGIPGAASEAMKLPESGRLGARTSWNLRGYVAPRRLRGERSPRRPNPEGRDRRWR